MKQIHSTGSILAPDLRAAGIALAVLLGCATPSTSSLGAPDRGGDENKGGSSSSSTSSSGNTPEGTIAFAPNVILVHASSTLPAVRLCVGEGGAEALPTDTIMPRSNRIGVDVGGAAYLGTPSALGLTTATPAYLIDVTLIESFNRGRHASCQSVVDAFKGGEGRYFWSVKLKENLASTSSSILAITDSASGTPELTPIALDKAVPSKSQTAAFSAAFVSLSKDVEGASIDAQIAGPGTRHLQLVKPGRDVLVNTVQDVDRDTVPFAPAEFETTMAILKFGERTFQSSLAFLATRVYSPIEPQAYYQKTIPTVLVAVGSLTSFAGLASTRPSVGVTSPPTTGVAIPSRGIFVPNKSGVGCCDGTLEPGGDVAPDFRAGSIAHFGIGQFGADASQHGHGSRFVTEDHPRPLGGLHRIRQWTDHGYVGNVLLERQQPAFILEQYHRTLRCPA